MATKVPSIPKPPPSTDPQLRAQLESLTEAVEIRLGRRGDPRDRAITLRELISGGLANELQSTLFDPNNINQSNIGFDTNPTPDTATPPAPTSVEAAGTFTQVFVTWDFPNYGNHSFTEIFAHSSDAVGDAQLIGVSTGLIYLDPIGPGSTRYYWVRHVSTANVTGPYNSGTGTLGQTSIDVDALVADMTAKIPAVAFANGIEPISVVGALPAVSGYTGPKTVFLTTDAKLYRYDSTVPKWSAEVPAVDISGSLNTAQINDLAITAAKFASDIEPIRSVSALPSVTGYTGPKTVFLSTDKKLYRYDSSVPEWTAAVPAADVTGTLAASKIDSTVTAGAALGATASQVNRGLAMFINADTDGDKANGEIMLCGVNKNGVPDPSTDGWIVWQGQKITVDRIQANPYTLLTNVTATGFIAFDTAKGDPYFVWSSNIDVAFAFKKGNQWYYDNNSDTTGTTFTPTDSMVAIGWMKAAYDNILAAGLFGEPVSLTLASMPGDVYESGSIGGINITESKLYQGSGTFNNANTGFYLDSDGLFSLKDKLNFNGSTLTIDGNITAQNLNISNAAVVGSFDKDNLPNLQTMNGALVAGQIGAGVVTANEINAGSVRSAVLTSESVTTDKLLVTGRGAALNSDPLFQDSTAWIVSSNAVAIFTTITDGVAGNTVLRTGTGYSSTVVRGAEQIPLDPTKTYRVRGIVRRNSSSNGRLYIGVHLEDSSGTRIGGDGTYWSYDAAHNVVASTSFTSYSAEFGAGTANPFPSNARTMAPLTLLNNGGTAGFMEIQDLRIEEKVGADLIVSGSIAANHLASNSVTTDKLLVTGRGAALNSDPMFQDETAWVRFSGQTASFVTITDGVAGMTALRSGNDTTWYNGSERIPFDPTKNYRVRGIARRNSSANGRLYIGVALFDANGANISGAGSQWSYDAASYRVANTSFTSYSANFGAGTNRTFPSNAKTMAPLFILNYNGSLGYMEIQDLRIEEAVGADLIVDGAIAARHLGVDSITANSIQAGSIRAGALSIGAIDSENLIVDGIIATNHMTSNTIDGGVITGNTLLGDKIKTESIVGDKLDNNTIQASKLLLDNVSLTADSQGRLRVEKIDADMIETGTLDASKITVTNLTALDIEGDISRMISFSQSDDIAVGYGLTATTIWSGVMPENEYARRPYCFLNGWGLWENNETYKLSLEMRIDQDLTSNLTTYSVSSNSVSIGSGTLTTLMILISGNHIEKLPANATIINASGTTVGIVANAFYTQSTGYTNVLVFAQFGITASAAVGTLTYDTGSVAWVTVGQVFQRANWDYHAEPFTLTGGLSTTTKKKVDIRMTAQIMTSDKYDEPTSGWTGTTRNNDRVMQVDGMLMELR